MSVLAVKHRVTLNRSTQAPHHGKGPCDSQGGVDKNKLKRFKRRVKVPETRDIKGFDAHTVYTTGNAVRMASHAERCCQTLQDEDHIHGARSHRKNAKRDGESAISLRHCFVQHHGNADDEATATVPLENANCVAKGFKKDGNDKCWGMSAHCHFVADCHLGIGCVAARRTPCLCNSCQSTLTIPWMAGVAAANQPRFVRPQNCTCRDTFGHLNDWKITTLVPGNDADGDEIEEVFDDVLGHFETKTARDIKTDGFGAYEIDDGDFCVVKWTSEAFSLETDRDDVEGMDGNTLPAGTIVVEGKFWNKVGRTKRWFAPPPATTQPRLFRVRHVVNGNLTVEEPSDATSLPPGLRGKQRILLLEPMRVSEASVCEVEREIAIRAMLDCDEGTASDSDEDDGDDKDSVSSSDDDSSSASSSTEEEP